MLLNNSFNYNFVIIPSEITWISETAAGIMWLKLCI